MKSIEMCFHLDLIFHFICFGQRMIVEIKIIDFSDTKIISYETFCGNQFHLALTLRAFLVEKKTQ